MHVKSPVPSKRVPLIVEPLPNENVEAPVTLKLLLTDIRMILFAPIDREEAAVYEVNPAGRVNRANVVIAPEQVAALKPVLLPIVTAG